jgi:hypothetical protein
MSIYNQDDRSWKAKSDERAAEGDILSMFNRIIEEKIHTGRTQRAG